MTLAVNFEAEQALLGCLLNDIGAFDRLPVPAHSDCGSGLLGFELRHRNSELTDLF